MKGNFRLSIYWKCQIIGWAIVSLFWLYLSLYRDAYNIPDAIINYFLDIIICIALTHAYRMIALKKKWNSLSMRRLVRKVIPALLVLSIIFMLLMNLKMSAYVYLRYDENIFLSNLLVWNPVLITGLRHMSIWLLAYHLYHFYLREVTTVKTNAQLSVIAKQAQLDNLSAQLNPHFLFNSLNSIKSLIMENPQKARRAVTLLSDLLRSSLFEKHNTAITIEEELALVKDYIELEKLRFEERLELNIEIDHGVDDFKVPPLSIQLLVENAIKHGIDKQIEGGMIDISISRCGDAVQVVIKNPGLLVTSQEKGLGLKNLKERLFIQYQEAAHFKIEKLMNEVKATMTIPMHIE